jgi:signal transduction histidine kinase
LTRIIEKRFSLHKHLTSQKHQVDSLKEEISRLQALANIGTAACMIGHEINNLLAPVASYAALAMKNPDDKMIIEKAIQKAARNTERASKITESMLALANGEAQEKKSTRLIVLLEEVFGCLARDFSKDGITVNVQIPEELTVWAVPVQIQQALMNLILNAREAMLPHGGILTIRARETADSVHIDVTDTGCGIRAENLKSIFEPFYTTKMADRPPSEHAGSGLGLAFCKKVVDSHAGSIRVESKPACGTTFTITLPKRGHR